MNLKIMIFAFFSLFGTSCFQASDHGGQAVQGLGRTVSSQAQREQECSRKLSQWFEGQEKADPELMKRARIVAEAEKVAEVKRRAEQLEREALKALGRVIEDELEQRKGIEIAKLLAVFNTRNGTPIGVASSK
jgi:hypothetical protein